MKILEPKEYICDKCVVYKKTLQEDEITNTLSTAQENHIAKVQEARQAYKGNHSKAWNTTCRVYAVDMQKILLLPIIRGLKSCIFTPRLIVFNETFASMKVKEVKEGKMSTVRDKHYAEVWVESTAGRTKEYVANAFLSLIKKERDVHDFVSWTDNCASQNKNWCLYNAMVILINSETNSIASVSSI